MTTRARRAFCPRCGPLEPRGLLSTLAAPARVAAVSTPPPAPAVPSTTAPAPGNAYVGLADWLVLHRQDDARARSTADSVVFFGDSLVYFWGDPSRPAHPEILPAWGTASWNAYIAPERAANFGIPGDYTQSVLWRVENGELAGKPKVAVVLVGINNLIVGDSPAETAEGVAAVASAVRAESPKTQVLLLGLLPPTSDSNNPLRAEVTQVNAMLRGWSGTAQGVRFLDPGATFLEPDGTAIPGLLQTTSIHPTQLGYQVLGEEVQPVLKQMLGGRGG